MTSVLALGPHSSSWLAGKIAFDSYKRPADQQFERRREEVTHREGSCLGRCGEVFNRGQQCTCDFNCRQHKECCPDFEATCTPAQSCQGRCGETFRRGQLCECDPMCSHYNTCCHDYQLNCGVNGPAGSRPSTLQDVAHALGLSAGVGGSEGTGIGLPADIDLCSDSPINGLTALINGAILIFKGGLFWSIDPVSSSVGRPQNITDILGISTPIDSVFTRSNCKGNTYIIKGDQYWRLDENMVMQPGFPKPLSYEFPGLTGSISAVLAVPATRSRPETLYFFKNGGDIMQKFTFPPESTPSCRENPRSFLKKSLNHPAEVLLSGEINIKVSLKGFPTPITSALSMPSPQGSDGYQHFLFSGPLFFKVQISGDFPALVKPNPSGDLAPLPIISPAVMATNPANMAGQNRSPPHPVNSIRFLLGCP
ncbi:proteoglycan 4a [Leuresthes tenuis]|uniref:proteoglycan 4a n=1 Tax=Leuresthes tenuis TaxID=355514 RepID=UPI003B50DA7A